jgi:hypothetical protein
VGLVTSPCLAVERLEVLSTPRIAAEPVDAARMGERLERLVKPKIETKREERPENHGAKTRGQNRVPTRG